MPVKASAIRGIVRTVEVDVFGEKINVGYRPGVITRAFMKRIEQISEVRSIEGETEEQTIERTKREMGQALSDVLVHWDYLDDNEKPLPITLDTFEEHVPQILSERIWTAIRKDQEVPKA
jgi:hypothetical protein